MMRTKSMICVISLMILFGSVAAIGFSSEQVPITAEALSAKTIDTTIENDTAVNAYYSGISGLKGDALQATLNNIIKDSSSLEYSETAYAMKITDRDWSLSPLSAQQLVDYDLSSSGSDDPYLNLLYAQYNGSVSTAFKWSADHQAIWNKEHIWAKSHGNFVDSRGDPLAPAGTDLHHLRAAEQRNNDLHYSYDFGVVDTSQTYIDCTDERGNASGKQGKSSLFSGDNVYEPRNEDKGDIARSIFYMATRYYTYLNAGSPKLAIIQGLAGSSAVTASATVNGQMGILSDLLAWNKSDPVSDFEIRRNNLIDHNFQGNRNPYIDHPEWVDIAYDSAYSGSGASISSGSSSVGSYVATLSSITIDASAAATFFLTNSAYSSTGLTVMANYSDGTAKPVTGFVTSPFSGTVLSTIGNQSITVSYTDGSIMQTASYEVDVADTMPVLNNLSVDETNAKTSFSLGSAFEYYGLRVIAGYESGNLLLSDGQYEISTPEMTKLGKQSVTVSYLGKTASYDIEITNANANVEIGVLPSTPTWSTATTSRESLAVSSTTGLANTTLDGIKWNLTFIWATGTGYFISNGTKGIQIGSTTNYASSFIMETEVPFLANQISDVLNIGVDVSGASGTAASLKVFVGGMQIGTTYSLQYSSGTPYFTASFSPATAVSGKVRLEFSQSTGKGIYLHGVSIYGATFEGGVTSSQQANAMAEYVLSLPACTMSLEDTETMIEEYGMMSDEAKTSFDAMANGKTGAKDRYDYIVSLHPEASSSGEGQIIEPDSVSVLKRPIWLIFVLLPFILLCGVGAFALFFRKKIR